MCGCEGFYVCPSCAGTPADPLYADDEPREPEPEREPDPRLNLFLAAWARRWAP